MTPALGRTSVIMLFLGALLLTSCSTPVGVDEVTARKAYQTAYANPLGAGVLSDQAKYVLNRYGLLNPFQKDPAKAIADLHDQALHDDRRDILYALAEVSYLHASHLADDRRESEQKLAPGYFPLSVLYSYYFSLEEGSGPAPTLFDQRSRNALDLYNFGLWQGITAGAEHRLMLQGMATYKLPLGQITVTLDASHLPWDIKGFDRFEPADKFAVGGVSVLNRTAGIGLPLVGVRKKSGKAPNQAVAVTAFLRIQGGIASLDAGTATASLELYSARDTRTVEVEDRTLPLETDTTTPLAYQLEGAKIWSLGFSTFLGKENTRFPTVCI